METKEKLGQEPAFPVDGENQSDSLKYGISGMSKRFYAACEIAPVIISATLTNEMVKNSINKIVNETRKSAKEVTIGLIYEYADEMLKQENL